MRVEYQNNYILLLVYIWNIHLAYFFFTESDNSMRRTMCKGYNVSQQYHCKRLLEEGQESNIYFFLKLAETLTHRFPVGPEETWGLEDIGLLSHWGNIMCYPKRGPIGTSFVVIGMGFPLGRESEGYPACAACLHPEEIRGTQQMLRNRAGPRNINISILFLDQSLSGN